MHTSAYILTIFSTAAWFAVVGVPSAEVLLAATAIGVAALGVPHGGLDHWSGRRWLEPRFGRGWAAVFFAGYLGIGLLFAAGWWWWPTVAVPAFFLISAWHFGREDQQAEAIATEHAAPLASLWFGHAAAAACGGVMIWGVVLFRPTEVASLLTELLPGGDPRQAVWIVEWTRGIAFFAVPAAIFVCGGDLSWRRNTATALATLATLAATCLLPVLISFAIHFCGWHSVRGLRRLWLESGLNAAAFVGRITPLSVAAIAIVSVGFGLLAADFELRQWPVDPGNTHLLRMTFIGLSAIAVPHLFLHELSGGSR